MQTVLRARIGRSAFERMFPWVHASVNTGMLRVHILHMRWHLYIRTKKVAVHNRIGTLRKRYTIESVEVYAIP